MTGPAANPIMNKAVPRAATEVPIWNIFSKSLFADENIADPILKEKVESPTANVFDNFLRSEWLCGWYGSRGPSKATQYGDLSGSGGGNSFSPPIRRDSTSSLMAVSGFSRLMGI